MRLFAPAIAIILFFLAAAIQITANPVLLKLLERQSTCKCIGWLELCVSSADCCAPYGCYDLDPQNGVGVRLLSILWVLSENLCGLIERIFGIIGM
jgi:hypothetical protein